AGAAARRVSLRRRAGCDRARRHAFRRGRRQYREHDGVAHAPRRQGADGAVDRLPGAAGARRAAAGRGLRRRALHLARVRWVVARARVELGHSFTASPRPRERGELVTRGPFRGVRHPVYLGATLLFVGLSLLYSWPSLILSGALGLLWAAKARVEERYLVARF